MTRVFIMAAHYAEYTMRYADALSRICSVTVCVDRVQVSDEWGERPIPNSDTMRTVRSDFKNLLDILRLMHALMTCRPHIVHLQEAAGPRRRIFNAVVAAVARPFCPVFLTVHDPVTHPGRDSELSRSSVYFRDYVRRLASKIVVHGQYCRDKFLASNKKLPSDIVLSTHGVLLSPEEQRCHEERELNLIFFGRMEIYKGLEVLCSAAESLHAEGVTFKLVVAGRGPELDRLQDRLAALPEVTVINGFVSPLSLIQLIQDSCCVVLPYLSASQSGVVAAAFANRRYVIASRAGGLEDVVEHETNGLLIPPGDVNALCDAIKLLTSCKQMRRKLEEGAEITARHDMNWERIALEMNTEYSRAREGNRNV